MMEKILSKKKKVHLLRNGYRFVFVCIYTLLYAYVYPYNHKNMCLGCPGRGPGTWEPLSSPKHHRNHEKLKGSENPHYHTTMAGQAYSSVVCAFQSVLILVYRYNDGPLPLRW